MSYDEIYEKTARAFGMHYQDFQANKEVAIACHNAIAKGDLIERTTPKKYESWLDENGVKMVAMPVVQIEELTKVKEQFDNLQSRSELRRKAVMKGEEMPTFDKEPARFEDVG